MSESRRFVDLLALAGVHLLVPVTLAVAAVVVTLVKTRRTHAVR
jgi:hypothetical protein